MRRRLAYGLDARPEWSGPLRFSARTLIYLASRNIQQLNLPTSPLATNAGMSSEMIRLVDPATGDTPYTSWLRSAKTTGEVLYAGFYTTCELPNRRGRFVKVVFPLPDGSATVVLRPENRSDGSFALVSDGRRFGDVGYYHVHRTGAGTLRVKYLPMKKVIHIFIDSAGKLRTDHAFTLGKIRFLILRYEITAL